MKNQEKSASIMEKNTAALAQSLAILAFALKSSVTKSTQASRAEFKDSTISIKNKTKAKNKCSIKDRGKNKFSIKAGMIIKSSSLKAISYLSMAKMPSSAYLVLEKKEYLGFTSFP